VTGASQNAITTLANLSSIGTNLTISGNILPNSANTYNIGSSTYYFANLYSGFNFALNGTYKVPSYSFQSNSGTGFYSDGTDALITVNQNNILRCNVTNSLFYTNLLPGGTTSTLNLGGSSNYWQNFYSTNIYGTLQTAAQTNITSVGTLTSLGISGSITGALTPSATATYNLGTTGYIWNILNVGNVNTQTIIASGITTSGSISTGAISCTNITPGATSSYNCGSSSKYWSNTYTNGLYLQTSGGTANALNYYEEYSMSGGANWIGNSGHISSQSGGDIKIVRTGSSVTFHMHSNLTFTISSANDWPYIASIPTRLVPSYANLLFNFCWYDSNGGYGIGFGTLPTNGQLYLQASGFANMPIGNVTIYSFSTTYTVL
jgi:hypothetical protein